MGHSTARTTWPTIPVPDEIKALIDKFFSVVDDPNAKSGDVLADEIFTPDGIMTAAAGTASGSAGMSRDKKNGSSRLMH